MGEVPASSPGPSQPAPSSPGPSQPAPSYSSSQTEDSFDIGVLLEPFSETDIEDTSGKEDRISALPSPQTNHPGAGASSNTGSGAEEMEQLVHKHKYKMVLADCHSKEEQIMNSVLMKEEFARAGRDFPQTAPFLSKEKALKRVLDDLITNENARKGMNQGANLDEIRLYTLWLSKILNRLYEEDQYYEYRSRQIQARRSDVIILGKIYETYKKWNDHFSK